MTIQTLVVDNNPVHLKAVSSILAKEGCEVTVAKNGLEALESLKKKTPDILFTDLVMPMVDGEQLCKIVRGVEEYKNIFLVVLSAIILEDKERILSEIDCDVYIAKGTLSEIRVHLKKTLAKYRDSTNLTVKILGDEEMGGGTASSSVMKELLLEKEHLLRMLENLSEGIVELSPSGKIVSINSAAVTIWEFNREEIISKNFEDLPLGNHSELITKWCGEQLLGQGGETLEIQEADPMLIGDKVITASFLPVRHESKYFAICILRDITRQFFAEREKEAADNAIKLIKKMDAMSCMAGGVAHDFNNILTVICGNLDMIADQNIPENSEDYKKLLQNARLSAYSAVELVRKISDFSPFGTSKRQNCNLDDFVNTTVRDFCNKSGVPPSKIDVLQSDIVVSIDLGQMTTALNHILQNSIEHGSDQDITIIIDREVNLNPQIRSGQYIPAGHYGKIIINDRGIGIPPENLNEIFDPYFSTKERGSIKGMGLGLSTVYSTLRNHGGAVVVESQKHSGTSVTLFLPLNEVMERKSGTDQKGKAILLLENDDNLLIIGKIMMEYLKYSVVGVRNRSEAISSLRADRAGEQNIAIAILNLSDGGESEGIDTCKALREIHSDLKVILSSGPVFDPIMNEYKKFGFAATLEKPYVLDDLKRVLSRF